MKLVIINKYITFGAKVRVFKITHFPNHAFVTIQLPPHRKHSALIPVLFSWNNAPFGAFLLQDALLIAKLRLPI